MCPFEPLETINFKFVDKFFEKRSKVPGFLVGVLPIRALSDHFQFVDQIFELPNAKKKVTMTKKSRGVGHSAN